MRILLCALACAGLMAPVGCSALLDFNANQTPCLADPNTGLYECLKGFTCAPGPKDSKVCVADQSLSMDDACYADAQCPQNALCTAQKCQAKCDKANVFRATAGCGGDRYCAPYVSTSAYSDGGSHPPDLVAACRPSDDCQVGQFCTLSSGQNGGVCVGISNFSRACLPQCQISYTANVYSDNCPDGYACVPVGPVLQQQLVCVQNAVGGQVAGGACSNVAGQPCPRGYLCSYGTCARWCEPTSLEASSCDTGQRCCAFQINSASNGGFCAASCP